MCSTNGYDSFGLAGEQYAIQTGPTRPYHRGEINRLPQSSMDSRLSYDWSREVRTCEPTTTSGLMGLLLEMFAHYYDNLLGKARRLKNSLHIFAAHGTEGIDAAQTKSCTSTAAEWKRNGRGRKREHAPKLPSCIPRRHNGQLVRRIGHSIGQRRGQRGAVGSWRIPGCSAPNETVASEGHGLCTAPFGGT